MKTKEKSVKNLQWYQNQSLETQISLFSNYLEVAKLKEITVELMKINRSAAKSLEEGLEETLTIHRLGLVEELGRSFTTTNLIENLNSQLKKYVGRVKR